MGYLIMGMFDKLKTMFGSSEPTAIPKTKAKTKSKSAKTTLPTKTEKEIATEKGEPWVAILSMDIDPENLHQGAFELDWNDKFVANLVRAGYQGRPEDKDSDIVDRWFQNVCRHVVMETWEQEMANNPTRVVKQRDMGDGRTEVS
jgi:hypothetical protein